MSLNRDREKISIARTIRLLDLLQVGVGNRNSLLQSGYENPDGARRPLWRSLDPDLKLSGQGDLNGSSIAVAIRFLDHSLSVRLIPSYVLVEGSSIRVTGFGVCLLQGRSSGQWRREEDGR